MYISTLRQPSSLDMRDNLLSVLESPWTCKFPKERTPNYHIPFSYWKDSRRKLQESPQVPMVARTFSMHYLFLNLRSSFEAIVTDSICKRIEINVQDSFKIHGPVQMQWAASILINKVVKRKVTSMKPALFGIQSHAENALNRVHDINMYLYLACTDRTAPR